MFSKLIQHLSRHRVLERSSRFLLTVALCFSAVCMCLNKYHCSYTQFVLLSFNLPLCLPLSFPSTISGSSERTQVLRYRSQDTKGYVQ